MKVLIDTCIWSLVLRRKTAALLSPDEQQIAASLSQAIREGRAAIIGPIRQEILSGIKDPIQFQKIQSTLTSFRDEQLSSADFEEAARLFNLCRSRGVVSGPIDILLCAVAKRRQWAILTSDQGLRRSIAASKEP